MSEDKNPSEFQPIDSPEEAARLLTEGAKTFASTLIWTKNQENVLKTHLTVYQEQDKQLLAWMPKDGDLNRFMADMAGGREVYFSVSLAYANIFFKTLFMSQDAAGLRFLAPERVFKVQRRKDLRFRVPEGAKSIVEFDDPQHADRKASRRLFDLSASGLAFLADTDEKAHFPAGKLLTNVKFSIRTRDVVCDAEVRQANPVTVAKKNQIKVGLVFKNIRAADSQAIASYVFEESRRYFLRFV